MITIRGRLATYGATWLDDEIPTPPGVDILLLTNQSYVADPRHCTPFLTLVHDLEVPEERLFAGFNRTVRYEVRRAAERDALVYRCIAEPGAHLEEFCDFYDAFAAAKSIHLAYRRELYATCDAGKLVLSAVEHQGTKILWHAYITSRTGAMLCYSTSAFRETTDTQVRSRVARANRWAHWQDMLQFRMRGLRWFDWGGLFSDESVPEHASVNSFKRAFGGMLRQNYECKVPVTTRGRLALAAIALKDKLSSLRNAR